MKQWIKHGIKMALDANLSPTTLLVILIKKPIYIVLEQWAPDKPEQK